MNTHKAAVKTAKAYKDNVRNERFWMKVAIRKAVHQGKECITRSIYYAENLDWLKENGFQYTKHSDYRPDYNLYLISWKDANI